MTVISMNSSDDDELTRSDVEGVGHFNISGHLFPMYPSVTYLVRLAVEQKNRAHKIYAVAHHINLHAQTLQI